MKFVRRTKSRKGKRGAEAGDHFDLTPMIDVVMQLIIFFMFTSQFAQVIRSQMELPQEPGERHVEAGAEGIIVDVLSDGAYLVAGEAVERQRIAAIVTAEIARVGAPAEVRVLVRADRSTPARHINALAEEFARHGVRGWRLGTAAPQGGGGGA